ncbi:MULTISPECIES: XRE family transcriptional regulator [Microcella]|uniref:helix-turn-helix domain-containing protein n=1 Tax=Microcella TaxID=337004 RepID=UPI0015CF506E|nr:MULTISPECIES: XRE family transcriptional regulator [Microcella]QOD93100.1 helix-turn-helix transcriptional regulator [Chryseoglobus sp. 28M-23]
MGDEQRDLYEREVQAIGATIRQVRKRLGLTVEGLATRAGVSSGMVSQLERGMGNPALESLARLAQALSIPLSQLVHFSEDDDRQVVRRTDRRRLDPLDPQSADDGLVRELLTPGSSVPIQVIRTVMPPGFSNESRPFRHLGMECVVVLEGRLLVHYGGEEVILEPGDAMTYHCATAHWWANAGDVDVVVLGAVTPQAP